jgi:hypothetical protein
MYQRCSVIKKDGTRCKAFCVTGDDKCLYHTDKTGAFKTQHKEAVETVWTKTKQILILQKELNRVMRTIKDPVVRSKEVTRYMALIIDLQKAENQPSPTDAPKPEEAKSGDPVADKLRQWKNQQ